MKRIARIIAYIAGIIIAGTLAAVLFSCGEEPTEPRTAPLANLVPGNYLIGDFRYADTCTEQQILNEPIPGTRFRVRFFEVQWLDDTTQGGVVVTRGTFWTTKIVLGTDTALGNILSPGDIGIYEIIRDTLWLALPLNPWLNIVPYTTWRGGMVKGKVKSKDGCRMLWILLRLDREGG